ncbi:SWIB-domain-containing protein [Exidia glandulosa HHB12029]|uniref:SWIB-domain-containing protein n=1 Tax=Exidia glandulosa HHB12029 TaxID=1314781 RepID=A0A165BHC6_EXIGL|nr:SWIB-domain-containing protein [Exidia glandulosa HHB12029]KZV85302.1 SWIB-domain-containing protein [Exidia glandulosa HHB12029]
MSVDDLAPAILRILSDPATNLASISAKRVRKQLVDGDEPITTTEFIRANKDAVDALIGQVFEQVSAERGGIPSPPESPPLEPEPDYEPATPAAKRKRDADANGYSNGADNDDDDAGSAYDENEGPSTPPPAKKHKSKDSAQKKSGSRSLTDEELARQLSQQLNSNQPRRSGSATTTSKRGASRTPKKVKKSRDVIDDDSDLDVSDAGRTKKKKTARKGGGGGGGFQKPLILSPPLASVLAVEHLSRPQVVKKLWEYIRENNLQNPNNKRQILCDPNLRAVFKQDRVDMFTMNKLLKDHLTPLDE